MILLAEDWPDQGLPDPRVAPLPPTPEGWIVIDNPDHPVCPWCGSRESQPASHAGQEGRSDCSACGRSYLWDCRAAVHYATARRER